MVLTAIGGEPTAEPPVRVAAEPCVRQADGLWRATFRVGSRRSETLRIESAWLPHGRFRSERWHPPAPAVLAGRGSRIRIDLAARCQESPGATFENAFLIVVVRSADAATTWRVLARFTVSVGPDGTPDLHLRATTAHLQGFAAGSPPAPSNPTGEPGARG